MITKAQAYLLEAIQDRSGDDERHERLKDELYEAAHSLMALQKLVRDWKPVKLPNCSLEPTDFSHGEDWADHCIEVILWESCEELERYLK